MRFIEKHYVTLYLLAMLAATMLVAAGIMIRPDVSGLPGEPWIYNFGLIAAGLILGGAVETKLATIPKRQVKIPVKVIEEEELYGNPVARFEGWLRSRR